MKRLPLILLCLACLSGGFALKSLLETTAIAAFLREYGPWIAIFACVTLVVFLVVLWVVYRRAKTWLHRALGEHADMNEAQIVTGLVDQFTTPEGVTNPTPPDRQRAAMVNLGLWLARRQLTQFYFNVTVTVVGGLVGMATIFLLYEQNQKIEQQNERITLQTDANITQSVLLEGARRASLSADMAQLFADIRAERDSAEDVECEFQIPLACWDWNNKTEGTKLYRLSPALKKRVHSFARRSTPYRLAIGTEDNVLQFDRPLREQFDFPNLSPERGQLLETLAQTDFKVEVDFSFAHVAYARIENARMANANLSNANFHRASLFMSDLRGTILTNANFSGASLTTVDLDGATMWNVNLSGAYLDSVKLDNADLNDADLSGVRVKRTQFTGTNLSGVDLSRAVLVDTYMAGVNLSGARITGAILRESNLTYANLAGADLTDAKLNNADLFGVNISNANFTGAKMVAVRTVATWTWADTLPIGLDDAVTYTICTFKEDQHSRDTRPDDCE